MRWHGLARTLHTPVAVRSDRKYRTLLPGALVLLAGCVLEVGSLDPRSSRGTDRPDGSGVSDAGADPDLDAGVTPGPTASFLVAASDLDFSVLDLSDPSQPRGLGETGSDARGDEEPLPLYALAADELGRVFAGRWGGVEVYSLSEGRLRFSTFVSVEQEAILDLEVVGDHAFLALGQNGVLILDLRDLDAVQAVSHIPAELSIHELALIDPEHLAIYDGSDSALRLFDVRNPSAPLRVTSYLTDFVSSRSSGLAAANGFLALNAVYGAEGSGLWFFETSALPDLTSLGFNPRARAPRGGPVALWPVSPSVFGYFSDLQGGVVIAEARADGADPRNGHLDLWSEDVVVHDAHLYVAEGEAGIGVFRLDPTHPETPQSITTLLLSHPAQHLVRVDVREN